jgi:hypothetical protein
MSDNNYNTGHKVLDFGLLTISWIGSIMAINITLIPIVFSSIASILACINYYYQIKKNKS